MTREVVGAEPRPTVDEPMVIVFDLGELTHGQAPATAPPTEPIYRRMSRLRPPRWQSLIAVLLAVGLGAAAGWHLAAGRAESRQAALTQAHPPALAWLTFMGSTNDQASGRPHVVLDLNVMNLGPTELRVASVVSHTERGAATAVIRPNETVVAAPGETAHRIVDVGGRCDEAYTGASLRVDLRLGTAGLDTTTAQVDTVDDGSVGVPYADVLQALCAPTGPSVVEGGLDGIYVQQTSHAEGAVLVITNHASSDRQVSFATTEQDGFELHAAPRGVRVLGPGRSVSVLLTFTVNNCRDVGRLSNYAEGVSLQVQPQGASAADLAAHGPAAELGLRDSVLAPLGSAVQKACH